MRPGPPSAPPPSNLVLGLTAQDLTATRDFYVRDVGLAMTVEEASRLVVRVGATTLEFLQHDGPLPLEHDLRLTFECDDPAALLRRLRALSVEVDVPPPAEGRGTVFSARDPDGRRVSFATRPRTDRAQ